MKLRKIRVMVKPWKDVWKEEKKAARGLDRGPKEPRSGEETLYFTSIDELRHVLTDKRIELLRLIHTAKPGSIKELAALAKKDFKNVNGDVHLLARLGLLNLADEKVKRRQHGRKAPRVSYAAVSVEIPLA
jgi:predicted transcriptional regulator